jgi:hypothetical protein
LYFLHFSIKEVVKQKWQHEQNIPHIHSTYPAWEFAGFSDAIENVSKPCGNRHKTVVHTAKTAKRIKLIILIVLDLHRLHI